MVLGDIRRMAGDLVCDHALLDVVLVWQPKMFLRRHVAQHGGTIAGDFHAADRRRDVVVAGSGVSGKRSEGVERGVLADRLLHFDVHAHGVERNVPRSLDHHLHVMLPCALSELAKRHKFRELRRVVGIGQRARTQTVAKRERHIVLGEDLAKLVEMRVQEAFLMMLQAPFGHDRTATGNDARHAVGGQRHETKQHARMDGHVVYALLALLDHGVAEQLPAQLGSIILHLFERLVHWHGANRNGGVAQDPFAGGVDVVAGGQVHHGVGAPLGGPRELLHFLVDGGGHSGIAHVGVELGEELRADDHRLGFRMVDVAWHHGTARGQFGTHQLHVAMLAFGHIAHFRRDDVVARVPHLRHRMILRAHRLVLAAAPFLGCLATLDGALAVILQIASASLVFLDVAAVENPVQA